MKFTMARNEEGIPVVIFPKDRLEVTSLSELEWFLGNLVDGVLSTDEDFIIFFSSTRTIKEVMDVLDLFDFIPAVVEIDFGVVPYLAPIPIVPV